MKLITVLFLFIICMVTFSQSKVGFNSYFTKKGNIVWGGAMQLAWNQLRNQFNNKQPLQFITSNDAAKQTISNFNNGKFSTKDINQKDIYVKSGLGKNTIDTINKEVKQKFPQKSFGDIDADLSDRDIISYAYLLKKLKFQTKFQRSQVKNFQFNGKAVESFYAQNQKQKRQVLVQSYENRDKFVVKIRSKQSKDQLIMIKDPSIASVADAIKLTKSLTKKEGEKLKENDIFKMPVIKLNVQRKYGDMVGLQFASKRLQQYQIGQMFEGIKLEIDQSGAKVQNQAVIIVTLKSFQIFQQQIKQIVLDKQFWIIMKEHGKHPYLCAKIVQPIDE